MKPQGLSRRRRYSHNSFGIANASGLRLAKMCRAQNQHPLERLKDSLMPFCDKEVQISPCNVRNSE